MKGRESNFGKNVKQNRKTRLENLNLRYTINVFARVDGFVDMPINLQPHGPGLIPTLKTKKCCLALKKEFRKEQDRKERYKKANKYSRKYLSGVEKRNALM